MNTSLSVVLLFILALSAANLPFLNERLLAVLPLRVERKPFWLRGLELLFFYVLVGLIAWLLEASLGNVQVQHWEFYAVTFCFFLVLAYPGFVWRYLKRRHHV